MSSVFFSSRRRHTRCSRDWSSDVCSSDLNSGADHQRLHALDLTSGAELLAGPRDITATYLAPGGGTRTFDAGQYAERAALLLSRGEIYTSWTSHCDISPYTGWVIAYGQTNLAQTAVLNVAPNGTRSGAATAGPAVWMRGGGPPAGAARKNLPLAPPRPLPTTPHAKGFSRQPNHWEF